MARDNIEILGRGDAWVSWRPPGHGLLECGSHALRDDNGSVWLIDPIDGPGLEALLADLGSVAGVIVLVDRHLRDSHVLAVRHDVPLHVPAGRWRIQLPPGTHPYDTAIPGCPFEFVVVQQRDNQWLERALWWPEHSLLVVAESVGNARYFTSRARESLAVHPFLRFGPPQSLLPYKPEIVLVGHGSPVVDNGPAALRAAIAESRSSLPAYAAAAPGHVVRLARAALGAGRASC
jgi:hypothetical protein